MIELVHCKYDFVKIFRINRTLIDRVDFALCKQPRETLDSYYARQTVKPDLMCNGGFFNMSSGDTVFTFVDERNVIAMDQNLNEGMGVLDNELRFGNYDSRFKDFISGYPVLIKEYMPVTTNVGAELDYNARRTILGYDNTYLYMIAVESPGLRYSKMKELLVELKIKHAINLDGGGSTRILKEGKVVTNSLIYNRPVDNVVCVYLKKINTDSPNTIYRVQIGAFSNKGNAEIYQKTIRALDDSINAGYKNAYIRLIDNLYKVQVGAFSKRENAEKVVKDLKEKGFNSFITTK